MVRFTTLGAISLLRDGADVHTILSQPKRLALLAYLALNSASGFESRDRLLGLFWPEASDDRARNALRQALHQLRKALGDDVIQTRGDRELAINRAVMVTDAVDFETRLELGEPLEALELYRGDFLAGLHVDDAPEAERWISEQRERLRRQALRAAREGAQAEEVRGDLRSSALVRRRALMIDPHDEPSLQRLLDVLERLGERSAALVAYDLFAQRAEAELGMKPSDATQAQVARIRSAVAGSPATPIAQAVAVGREPSSAADTKPIPRALRLRTLGALLALAAIATIAVLGRRPNESSTKETPHTRAIAVLPFSNMSGDAQQDYFSDGIAEELMTALARVPGLQVVARTSAFAFKGKSVAIDSIARALRVQHLLEGSVRLLGDRLRVTAKLVDAGSGFQVWTDSYDARLADAFDVQDAIATAIVRALEGNLHITAVPTAAETRQPEAHRDVLRGYQILRQDSLASYRIADSLFRSAIARDSAYARAWAGLAHVRLIDAYRAIVPPNAGYHEAASLAQRAIAIDARVATAHVVLGRVAEDFRWDFAVAEEHYRRALDVAPGDESATRQLSRLYAHLGRADEATRLSQRLIATDPLAPIAHRWHGNALTLTGQHELALQAFEKALELQPDNALVHAVKTFPLVALGRFDEATASGERAIALVREPQFITNAAWANARAGRTSRARELLAELEAIPAAYYYQAMVHAGLGDANRAFALLDRAIERRESYLPQLAVISASQPLHADPRFAHALRRVGLRI